MESSGDYIDPLIGTMVGRYRVERKLGQGGMGAVYSLLQPAIHKRLALKLLHEEYAERQEIVRRFFDEARAVNLIGHPNIVDISDFSHLPDGRPFIIMEYLDGETLEDLLEREGRLDPADVMVILKQLCSALGAAHAKDIVHRDLKPENIYLVRLPDGALQIKVLDFGIAKLKDRAFGEGEQNATQTGVVLGTPTYMSPEQAEGKTQDADHRTDIYSLGIIIYQMFAGTPPFKGNTFAELILKHIHHAPPDLNETRPDISRQWGELVRRALSKDPQQRFQSMSDLFDHATRASEDALPASAHHFDAEDDTSSRPTNILDAVRDPSRDGRTDVVRTPAPPMAQKLSMPVSAVYDAEKPRRSLLLWLVPFVVLLGGGTAIVLLPQKSSDDANTGGPTLLASEEASDPDEALATRVVDAGVVTAPDAAQEAAAVDDDQNPSETSATEDSAEEETSDNEDESAKKPERSENDTKSRGTGTIDVLASSWSYVYLDGKLLGQTPINGEKVGAGSHKVKVKNGGTGETRTKRFRLKKGEHKPIRIEWD